MEDKDRSNFQPADQIGKVGRPKSEEKKHNILIAASDMFLQYGFTGTSMDLVSREAGVSKQTVYSHYNNKDALFSAVIDFKCQQYQLTHHHTSSDKCDLKAVLTRVGSQFLALLLDEQVIAMYRVVIGEVSSDPHVAEIFYTSGPQHGMQILIEQMLHNESHPLSNDIACRYASIFFNLLKGDFHMRSMLGLDYSMTESQQKHTLDSAVEHTITLIENDPLFGQSLFKKKQ